MSVPLASNSTVVATITGPQVPTVDSARQHLTLTRLGKFLEGVASGAELAATVDIQTAAGASAGSAATLTFSSVAAGEVIAVNGVPFIAVSGTPLAANNEFKRGVSDTADAASFATAVNASSLAPAVKASAVSGVVTLASQGVGMGTNGYTVETLGVLASGTLTPSGVAANDTFVINGVTFTAEQEMARQTFTISGGTAGDTAVLCGITFTCVASGATGNQYNYNASDTTQATNLAAAINACTSPTTGTQGGAPLNTLVTASSALGVVTVRAIASGTAANSFTTTATAGVTAGAATMANGKATSNNKFDYGDTTAQTIAEVLRAVAASTSALVNTQVFCTNTATLVTVYAKNSGVMGNTVTLAGTGGFTASAARLASGAVAQNWGVQASGTVTIASGSGNYTVTINGVNASGTVAYNTSDTQTGADIADAINKSTNALVAGVIRATAASGVVTITAIQGGTAGNAITLACTGTGATASGARLTGGAVPTHITLGGTGVSQSNTFAGARLAGGAGIPGSGGANASTYLTR